MRPALLALLMVVVTAIGFASPRLARAGSGNVQADLEAAETAYAELEFDTANKLSADVIKQRGLTHDQLVRAYRLFARTHAVLGHDKDARAAFVVLLTIAPDEKEDRGLPPKVTDRMMEARGVLSGYQAKPGIEVTPVLHAHEAGTLRVTTRDPTRIAKKVVVGWRWGAAGKFTTSDIATGDVTVDVPVSPANVSRLDYYVQAFDDRDDAVFEVGNPTTPKTISLAPPTRDEAPPPPKPRDTKDEARPTGKSIFASPIFWAVVGVVVIAGSVITYAATRPGTATSASLSPSLVCGTARCN